MNWISVASALIFLITLVMVIWQPRGLSIGWSACGGALLTLLFGIVGIQDVAEVTGMVWNATLAFVGIILVSLVLDEIGFFEWAALHMIRLSGGNGKKLFLYSILLGACVSALFANDGAVLILTPIILAQVRALRLPDSMVIPFAMAGGFISDTASLPFTISNLTNIITADFFGIGFIEYALTMFLPNLVSIAASMGVLYLFYRKDIPATVDLTSLPEPLSAVKHRGLFLLAWVVLAILFIGYSFSEWLQLPVSFIVMGAAVCLVAASKWTRTVQAGKLVMQAPWAVVFFSIGMYLVVFGLQKAGLIHGLTSLVQDLADSGIYGASVGMGFLAAALCSVMNNLPTLMINALAIDGVHSTELVKEALIYGNVIGSDLGPKITPIGSLATLLWLHVLKRKGLSISWGYYFKTGLTLTLPTLFVTTLALGMVIYLSNG